jgi:wyosine [tRNA(Phe)-imidazoG37] synthetase (radical SAM superfamily)
MPAQKRQRLCGFPARSSGARRASVANPAAARHARAVHASALPKTRRLAAPPRGNAPAIALAGPLLHTTRMLLYEGGPVYGPVQSRRLGCSLGVNVLPSHLKVCNFNCAYCQCGWTHVNGHSCPDEAWPSPDTIASAATTSLRRLAAERRAIDRLTIAGEGEPTLHPRFAEIVDRLRAVRDAEAPGVPIAILSNSSTVRSADVRRALSRLDERYMKLDAGDNATLHRLNGYAAVVDDLIADLASLPNIIVQTLFVEDLSGRFVNSRESHVEAWIAALERIRPIGVHVYTVDRLPAFPMLVAVAKPRLEKIAARAIAAGIPAKAF